MYSKSTRKSIQLRMRIELPEYESIQACQGHAGCPGRGRSENDYLYGGAPGVIVPNSKRMVDRL